MHMASSDIKSIGLFIDGNYFRLIDNGLKAEGRRVNIKGLIKYIQKSIAEKYELESSACVVTESHFFRGRYKAYDAKRLNLLLEDRKFEDRLIENDVVLHYKHIYDLPDGTPHEKGIDVWFALETIEMAMFRDFDFVVMITGDADFEMLARKLKCLKIPPILLSWYYDEQDATAKALKEEISFQMNINSLMKADESLKGSITEAASL